MHPILGNRTRLAVYIAAWALLGLLFSVVAPGGEPRSFARAASSTVPLALVYGFICLSAWWVCRAAPLARTSAHGIAMVVGGAAILASLFWAGVGVAGSRALAAFATHAAGGASSSTGLAPHSTPLFLALGIPLYLF